MPPYLHEKCERERELLRRMKRNSSVQGAVNVKLGSDVTRELYFMCFCMVSPPNIHTRQLSVIKILV